MSSEVEKAVQQRQEEVPDNGKLKHNISVDSEQDESIEPVLHLKTWITVGASCFTYLGQVALLSAAGFWKSAAAEDVGGAEVELWVSQAFQVVNAALGPSICLVTDAVGRKWIITGCGIIGTAGVMIMAGGTSMNMIIAGSVLFGLFWATLGAVCAIPSEVLPRRHRATAQLIFQAFGTSGVPFGTIAGGALVSTSPGGYAGWRSAFWLCAAIIGFSVLLFALFYNPPPVPNPKNRTVTERLLDFDRIGTFLFGSGLCLFMMALIWGGNQYEWDSKQVLSTLIIGLVLLIVFAIYETWGTKTGLLHHDMFKDRNFAICLLAIATEGMVYIVFNNFYGEETGVFFENRPVLLGLRFNAFTLGQLAGYPVYGYFAYKYRSVKEGMIFGFICLLGACAGLAALSRTSSDAAIGACFLAGFGFASPIALIATVIQLAVSPEFIGVASALSLMSRSVGGAIGTAIADAVFNSKINKSLPQKIKAAAIAAGLPESSIPDFVKGLSTKNIPLAENAPGVTPEILQAGQVASLKAYEYSFRYVWIVIIPFLVLTLIAVICLKSVREQMNQLIDRPVEKIHHHPHYENKSNKHISGTPPEVAA